MEIYIEDLSELDPSSALIEAERVSCCYEALITELNSKLLFGIIILTTLLLAIVGSIFQYNKYTGFSSEGDFQQLVPSLLVILVFAAASTIRHLQILHSTRCQARVAFFRQQSALNRAFNEMDREYHS